MKIEIWEIKKVADKHGITKIPKPKYLSGLSYEEISRMEAQRNGWNIAIIHFDAFLDDLRGLKKEKTKKSLKGLNQ